VRALKSIVRDIEAKLGPLEVSVVEKTSAETVAKNEDAEDIGTKTKGDAQVSATLNKNGADNAVNNEEENGKEDSAKNE
jgi:homogentisate solanesyltransferase